MFSNMADLITLKEALDSRFGSELLFEASRTGSEVGSADLSAISRWTPSEVDPARIVTFPTLAIDTKPTRNQVQYSAASQKASVKKWVGIPFLFNSHAANPAAGGADHTLQAASQVARIYKAQVVKTPAGETGTLVWFYSVRGVSVQTDEFIAKVETGILREVSIHVMCERANCSICGVAMQDCEKGHVPGQKYGRETCVLVTVGALEPLELSSVACPGSPNAHIMSGSEVGEYEVLSLREALGGTDKALATLARLSERNMTEVEKIEAARLVEEARVAAEATTAVAVVAETTEAIVADVPTDLPEATKCDKCDHAAHEGKECSAESCECDKSKAEIAKDDVTGVPVGSTESASVQTVLFAEGVCPACNRGPVAEAVVSEETRTLDAEIAKLREEMEARVSSVVTAATLKISEADAKVATAEALVAGNSNAVAHYAEMIDGLRKETVDLAIARGVKTDAQRGAYTEEIAALNYSAIKVLVESLRVTEAPREATVRKLQETSAERLKRTLGETVVRPEAGGKFASETAINRPRFASTTKK